MVNPAHEGSPMCRVAAHPVRETCASSKKYSGTGTASTAQEAKKKTLDECNNASCKVLIADCN